MEDRSVNSAADPLYGYLVSFDNVDKLLAGAAKVRDAGYTKWDSHTPFVVHGLDAAMGIRPTILPYLVFLGGLTGTAFGLLLQWYTNAFNYPFQISGKPIISLPAYIPVAFETAVLMAGLGTIAVLLLLSRLFPWSKPNLVHPKVTDDHFVLAIRQTDADLDPGMAERLLREHGAIEVHEDIGGEAA